MEVNTKKTEIMLFRNGGPLRNYEKWIFSDQVVRVTSVSKYMGILFTPLLSWSADKH